jgi:hypothetical protein
MDKGVRLSHSKVNKYKQCPRLYEFHYNKKIRTRVLGSPLFFGLAADEAINRLLLEKKQELSQLEQELMLKTPVEVFDEHMNKARILNKVINPKTYEHIQYSKSDYDSSLLEESDFQSIGQNQEFCDAHVEWYHAEKKKKKPEISTEDTALFNLINWHSLYRKGLMILEIYEAEIMPQIHEVFSIQKEISLPNDDNDEIIGFIDFICSFVDAPETKVIVDNKSSSKPYKAKDLDESDQLHTYAEAEGLEDICYIVYEKNVRKREPRVRITIWRGKVNEDQTEKTFDQYEEVLYSIKQEEFNPDFDSGCFFFGRRCDYHDICHKEKMPEHLVNLNKEKK